MSTNDGRLEVVTEGITNGNRRRAWGAKIAGLFRKQESVLLAVLLIMFAVVGILRPTEFLGTYNLQSMASQLPELGVISLAMMVVLIAGGIDLSIIGMATLAGVSSSWIMTHWGPVLDMGAAAGSVGSGALSAPAVIVVAVVAAFAVGLACGAINGFFVVKVGVSPILVTLATMTLFDGIALYFTKGGSIAGLTPQFVKMADTSLLRIPVLFIIFIVVSIVVWLALERSAWGRRIYMIGSNSTASLFSGINTRRATMSAYMFSGAMAAIAAIIMCSRYNSAKVGTGSSYILISITIVVLGGTAITGGAGRVAGTVIAVMIWQVLRTGFNILGLSQFAAEVLSGVLLVVVLVANRYVGRRRTLRPRGTT